MSNEQQVELKIDELINSIFRRGEKISKKELNYDLGCGNIHQKDYKGIDILESVNPDLVYDLEKYPWTFAKSGSVDHLACSHYLEHTRDFYKFFDECYRILKPNGRIFIIAPYYTSCKAIQDNNHQRLLCEQSFVYLSKEARKSNGLNYVNCECDFLIEKIDYSLNADFRGKPQDAVMYAIKHFMNVVDDMMIVLRKPK